MKMEILRPSVIERYSKEEINAIIKKSIMFAIKSPYLKSDVTPVNWFVTEYCNVLRSPDGNARPTIGLIMSLTSAVTSFDAAAPITNAIARPMIPKVLRK